jgi:O-antigen ligase
VLTGVLVVILVMGIAIVSLPQLRQVTYEGLRQIGALRIAQPLGPEADWEQLLGDRRTRWGRTLGVIEQRPLWGSGPRSIQALPMGTVQSPISGETRTIVPENTHNYFLQYAAEYGIPAAGALLWLIIASLAIAVRGALHHPAPRARAVLAGIVAGQVSFLVFSVVSHPMLLAECQAVYWTLSGLALSSAGSPSD